MFIRASAASSSTVTLANIKRERRDEDMAQTIQQDKIAVPTAAQRPLNIVSVIIIFHRRKIKRWPRHDDDLATFGISDVNLGVSTSTTRRWHIEGIARADRKREKKKTKQRDFAKQQKSQKKKK